MHQYNLITSPRHGSDSTVFSLRWQLPAQAVLALLLALGGGCQTETISPPSVQRGNSVLAKPVADACSNNMHDLAGYLLQYYVLHKDFPETLDALRPLADMDRSFPVACPVSGKPYLYFPRGLEAQGEKRRLVACDATQIHNGGRWAIVAMDPEGNTPIGLWVIFLEEKAIQAYHLPQ